MIGEYHEVVILSIVVTGVPGTHEVIKEDGSPVDVLFVLLGRLNSPPPGGLFQLEELHTIGTRLTICKYFFPPSHPDYRSFGVLF